MMRMICLDGVPVRLDVDRIEVDLHRPGLMPADHQESAHAEDACCDGHAWEPVMTFHDGTTVYLHGPADGLEGPQGYKVEGPHAHRWNITLLPEPGETPERVAKLSWEKV